MRDSERIQPFLNRLAITWKSAPDLRFGQLVANLSRFTNNSDIWNPEEPEWIKAMREFEEQRNG